MVTLMKNIYVYNITVSLIHVWSNFQTWQHYNKSRCYQVELSKNYYFHKLTNFKHLETDKIRPVLQGQLNPRQ